MKKYLYVFALLVFLAQLVSAQKATPAKPLEKKPVVAATATVKGATDADRKEKFDPTRDPVADLNEAIAKAQAEKKRIILDVGGEWCGWCRFMDRFFMNNPDVMKIRDENYVWLKVNMSQDNENTAFLASYPSITGYPHLFVLDTDGKLLHSQETSPLEQEKSYSIQRMTDFLTKWAPEKPAPAVPISVK